MSKEDKKSPEGGVLPDNACSELGILDSFSSIINQNLLLGDILDAGIERIMQLFEDVTGVEVHILDEEKQTLFLKTHRGLSPKFVGTGTLQVGEGLAGFIVESGQPLFVSLLTEDDRIDAAMVKKEKLMCFGGVPLHYNQKPLGALSLYTRVPYPFTDQDQSLLAKMGSRLGAAVHNALAYEQAALRATRFVTISRAITVTRQLAPLDEVLQDITKVLVQSLGFDQSWIALGDTDQSLQGKAGFGDGMTVKIIAVSHTIQPESKNPAVMAVCQQKPIVYQFTEDVEDEATQTWLKRLKVQSFGYIPILSGEQALGVIGVFHTNDQAFDEEDVKTLVSVAEQAAIAIENARLYEQIKTSEVRYRTLFEATGTGLVIIDDEQRFRLVNQAFEALSGYTREQLIQKMALTAFLSDSLQSVINIVKKLNNPPQSWETQFTDRLGDIRQVHLTTTHIPDSSDILVSLIDMTRERELERRLFRSEELAAIGELSAGIAHEIRNPLVAITTSVSLLKDEPEISQEGQQLLDVVKEESDHLAAIVDDFLKYARPKKPSFQDEDINQLVKDVVRRHRDLIEMEVEWDEQYDESLSAASLDRHQIQQVLNNLIINSLDAMSDGGTLTIKTVKEKRRSEEWIRLSINDTGEGIAPEDLSKIFQPFYSLKVKGTGMGLAICRRIIEEHGGDIVVESEMEKGTQFSVILPIRRNNENNPD